MTEIDVHIEDAKEQMREEYEKETGEELPQHVVDNYELLNVGSPSFEDIRRSMERGRELSNKDHTSKELGAAVVVTAVSVALISVGIGVALGSNFALGVVGVICALFGFCVGVLAHD